MSFRKKIVAGNWKMNGTVAQAKALTQDILNEISTIDDVDIVLCPPFTSLPAVSEILNAVTNVRLGAQNLYHEPSGAFTGEVSSEMLRDLYCHYVIVGHSERRQHFGETNEMISKKVQAVLAAGNFKPILCVGETLAEREKNQWQKVLRKQVEECLASLSAEQAVNALIAYEPVWAIGTGKTATPSQAQEAHHWIRGILKESFDSETSEKIRILYGGSVKPENSQKLFSQPDIDGALVGGASLDPRAFAEIIKSALPEKPPAEEVPPV